MRGTKAVQLKEGDMIDLEPILAAMIPDWDPEEVDISRSEMAFVERVEPADSVNGVLSVVLCTNQHNVKMPAALGVTVYGE